MGLPPAFVDHYEVLGCDRHGAPCTPSTPVAELRRAYFDKLRSFHPDKRQTSLNGLGHRVTQALNEAWAVLQDAEKKQAYDIIWRKEKGQPAEKQASEATHAGGGLPPKAPSRRRRDRPSSEPPDGRRQPQPPPPPPTPPQPGPSESPRGAERRPNRERAFSCEERAEACRKEGNELYKAAQSAVAAARERGDEMTGGATTTFQAAIAKYSVGIELAPLSHVLRSNRALCYAALKDWPRCREDARKSTQLKPDFFKGWFLLAKAIWKDGAPECALKELDTALRILPESSELLSLQGEILAEIGGPAKGRPDTSPAPGMPGRPSPAPPTPPRCSSCPPGARAFPGAPRSPPVPPGQPPVGFEGPAGFIRRAAAAAANHFSSRSPSAEGGSRPRRGRLPSLGKMAARSRPRVSSGDVL